LSCIGPNAVKRSTSKGPVCVRAFCAPEQIRRYTFDDQFRIYPQYKSIYSKRETLEAHAAIEMTNVTLALSADNHIIGFGVLGYPEQEERWARLGHGVMMEVKVIEVGRGWRGNKITNDIMKMLLGHPRLEEMIIYMVGYSWTWDIEGTGLTALQYRNMLIHIFGSHGFQQLQTNEPNICLKPENLFMGRVGAKVSTQTQQAFKWLCFGISPENA
jgi:acetoin utilization protein AcuA